MARLLAHALSFNRPLKRAIQMAADSLIIITCFAGAMFVRLESLSFVTKPEIWLTILPVIPLTILAFIKLGLYRSIVRFISSKALRAIAIGVVFSAVLLFVSSSVVSGPIPRSVPGIYALALLLAIGGVRFAMRNILRRPAQQDAQPIAIYGAGHAGRQLQTALQHGCEYNPVAFIDDDPALHNTLVAGLRVHSSQTAAQLVQDMQIKSILLAIPSANRTRRREIIRQIQHLGISIKTMPGMADIVSGRATVTDLRSVKPEDLLGRDPVPEQDNLMSRNITGKVVLVSGAGGSIGSELCRQIIKHDPAALVLFEVSEFALYSISMELRESLERDNRPVRIEPVLGSVRDAARIRAVMRTFHVQTVYHAAAYKHVVLVEENVTEGIRNNVFGTQTIAHAAAEHGVESFILVSTDKAVRPTNFMGASKRMAELVCQSLAMAGTDTVFSMVRFGNVLGSSGSVIPRFRAQIDAGGPVTVTHRDITRYFMTIPEASKLVIQAGAMAKGGDVFVLDMGEPVKILDLAQSMIRLHGLKPYIIDHTAPAATQTGDIAIKIVGLNTGEKLYEELLIGDNPQGTAHPQIMTATEVSSPRQELSALLDRLQRACDASDIAAIRQIFLDAPLSFQPTGDDLHDLIWVAGRRTPPAPRHTGKTVFAAE